jgi:ankyrin repeat protein
MESSMVTFSQNKIQPKAAFDLLQRSLISKVPNIKNELVMPKDIMTIILYYTLHPGMIQPLIDLIDSILNIVGFEIDKTILRNTRTSLVQFQAETNFSLETTQTKYNSAMNAISEAIKDERDAAIIKTFASAKEPIILILLEMPCINFETKDNYGKTLLMYSAEKGHKNVVMKLLENGADINAADNAGVTALMYAAENGHKAIVELLLNKGADIDAARNDDGTALMYAALNGHKGTAELLLNKGANINATFVDRTTALMPAAFNGHKEIVELLLNKGANVNAANNTGSTPLMLAAFNGHKEIVELLLNKGANINAATNIGNTALMFAVHKGHKEIAVLLLTEHKKQFLAQALIAPSNQLQELLDNQRRLGAELTREDMCKFLFRMVNQKETAEVKIKLLEDALKVNAFGTLMHQTDEMGLSSDSSAVTDIQKAIQSYCEPEYGTSKTVFNQYSGSGSTESKEHKSISPSFLAKPNI